MGFQYLPGGLRVARRRIAVLESLQEDVEAHPVIIPCDAPADERPRTVRASPVEDDRLVPVTVMPAVLAARLSEADLTYPEPGATAGVLPPGYHHLHRRAVIGSGPQVFTATADALASWQIHVRAGLSVSASSATAEPGSVLMLGLGAAAIRITAPCRVIYVIDEPGRRGFAYGTLPGLTTAAPNVR